MEREALMENQAPLPEQEPIPLQNTNVVNRVEDVERVSMRSARVRTKGGGVFSSIARRAPSTSQQKKRKYVVDLQPSPVRRSRRISDGLNKALNGLRIDLTEDE
ncbi:hypothetical protein MKX01_023043 [Papaver californicum]|nr:hypothetical protein MKX01_023043 [Papaver californicum]